ncbi:sulfite exporter TauE/SafE family protein [uncultured Methanobacterium sp.]|uniref:sulfite exporter TauE/SafE family protein n=1 Tax=uncultured Methanobacterium sp. TaxID=176306 RepID=UPI002AA682F2|nr:sulfite exporter TauE/SafE family protein [uncultured Methanobacterium sp.]
MIDLSQIFIPIFGFLIGLLVSTLGGGGGGLYVPVLTLVFGIPTQVAVATSLASVLPTTTVGAFSHYREGNVNLRIGIILGAGGVAGTLIGAYLANMIPSDMLRRFLGVFMLLMMIPMLRSFIKRHKNQDEEVKKENSSKNEPIVLTRPRQFLASLFGVASGLLAGIFGISGTPPVSAGLYSLGLPAMTVVGTTVFVLIFNSLTGIGGYFLLGRLDITLIILLAGGAAVGAFIGPKLLKKINPQTFEKIYVPVILTISLVLGLAMILA